MNENIFLMNKAGKLGHPTCPTPIVPCARLNLWEIDEIFKCPIVGACLTLSEQKHLMKKAGICTKALTDYEIHAILVSSCELETQLCGKIQNLLDRKYRKKTDALFEMQKREFMEYWSRCFKSGDYHAALWAGVSRPDMDIHCRREIFADIHMAMHSNAEQRAALTARLSRIEKSGVDMRQRLKEVTDEKRRLEKVNGQLQKENKLLKTKLKAAVNESQALAGRLAAAESERQVQELEQAAVNLQTERTELSESLAERNLKIRELNAANKRLIQECSQLTAVNQQMRESMYHSLNEMRRMSSCDETCPSFDLCSKRVLIVGGIDRMASLYRKMIEDAGGILDHHNGCVNGGARQLEDSLKRADLVLCPVNCNSHAACSLVKKLGKKYEKPTHMMANFSLSAVSRMIYRNGNSNSVNN
jgi:predicted nuclease with TOPRIM domain